MAHDLDKKYYNKGILRLGGINKLTGEYIYPKIANKADNYKCPECNKDIILCKGDIIPPYFRHKADNNPCNHYNSNPGETQIHKEGKMLMKKLLEDNVPFLLTRKCCTCEIIESFQIEEITEKSIIKTEYTFNYNGKKQADVAYIEDNEIYCIFEIYYSHKTCNENRPEPWFEIDAKTLIKIVNNNNVTSLEIPCIRQKKCDKCIKKENVRNYSEKIAAKKICDWMKYDSIKPFYCADFDGASDLTDLPPEAYLEETLTDDHYFTKHYIYDRLNKKAIDDLRHADIVIHDKSVVRYHIYFNKPSFTDIQFNILEEHGIALYFVDVKWVLKQKTKPENIECVIINDPWYKYHGQRVDNVKNVIKIYENLLLIERRYPSALLEGFRFGPGGNFNNITTNPFESQTQKIISTFLCNLKLELQSSKVDFDRVYLKISYNNKNKIKKYHGIWHQRFKVWSITQNCYKKYMAEIDDFVDYKILWLFNICDHCHGSGRVLGDKCWFC
jgi:uncharacterized protein YkuJ